VLDDDDPGWPWRRAPFVVFPLYGQLLQRRSRRDLNRDGLLMLRELFMAFVAAILLFGVVLSFMDAGETEPSPGLAVGLLALGVLAGIMGRVVERPLDCTSDQKLAASYRTRFFIRIAFSETAALFGFVGFFLTAERWVYPIAAAITLVGFARAAPTRAHLQQDQERLSERACFRSLVNAIRATPPSDPRR